MPAQGPLSPASALISVLLPQPLGPMTVIRSCRDTSAVKGANSRQPCCAGLRNSAHSAGVKVSATNPEITTAIATVTANCL